jgi:hypothetical protein
MNWIGYGKSFYQLRHELSQKGESIIGVQVDITPSEEYPSLCKGGLHLVGHVEVGSVISEGEHFEEIDNVFILRYRRLLSAEQLEENSEPSQACGAYSEYAPPGCELPEGHDGPHMGADA